MSQVLQKVSSSLAVYSGHDRTFTACASDLGWRAGYWPSYVDVQSERTGNVRRFMKSHERYDREGDLLAVVYVGKDELRFEVFND